MAGNGPLPKPERQRERDTKRRDRDFTVVRPDGQLRGPELDANHGYLPATVAWFEVWRRSPQAQLFEDTDWLALQLVLPLVNSHFIKPSAAAASEIRLVTAALGATHADRLRLAKIRVEHDADEAHNATVTHLHAVSKDDVTARLRGEK
jgi:hypothetical protein